MTKLVTLLAASWFTANFIIPTAFADSVTMYCPSPQEISVTQQSSDDPWEAYGYKATIPVNFPAFNNQLILAGQGSGHVLYSLSLATWTDGSFMCWYDSDTGNQIIYTHDNLSSTIDSCNFPKGIAPPRIECFSNNPQDCPLICTLKEA